MMARRAWALIVWLGCVVFAAIVVARAHYISDLSAFLPAHPTKVQQLLVDQLRDGPASRLILIAIEGGEAAARARISSSMASRLRKDARFSNVSNGETDAQAGDREFLFQHRYLLSDAVSAARFSVPGLHSAIVETLDNLSSPAALLLKSLLPRDPTGELPHILDQLASAPSPRTQDGVWVSPGAERALAVAQTAASGSDSDAQSSAVDAIRAAFAAAADPRDGVKLRLSGPGVFAVAARAKIERAAVRLSIISSILVVTLLLIVYRSLPALALGLLPVTSGALIGIAAVALGFGAVHGVTLGFGITLIGESVDYSIYFFIQSRRAPEDAAGSRRWQQRWWPTVRLGMLTSVCGFASLLPSGFPGLKQLGLYSIGGLIAAALVTRFVLPALLPGGFAIRDVTPLGSGIASALRAVRRIGGAVIAIALALALLTLALLYHDRGKLWNRELAALSPISIEEQNYDAKLRADLGAADVRDLVIVSGPDLESILRSAERTALALRPLVDSRLIGSFDSPANYLPSLATQEARRSSLPPPAELRGNLAQATADLPIHSDRLRPFLEDESTVAVGGIIRVVNGCTVEHGAVTKVGAPPSLLTKFQAVEYLRAFLGGRVALSYMNSLLLISGAFGLFRRESILEAGGFQPGSLAEDL